MYDVNASFDACRHVLFHFIFTVELHFHSIIYLLHDTCFKCTVPFKLSEIRISGILKFRPNVIDTYHKRRIHYLRDLRIRIR